MNLKSKKGIAIEGGLIALVIVSGFISIFLVINRMLDDSAIRRTEQATIDHTASNAANIAMVFHRHVMYRYYVWAGIQTLLNPATCPSPSSFLEVLSNGTQCGSDGYKLFEKYNDLVSDPNTEITGGKNIYSYTGDFCTISTTASDCIGSGINKLVVTVGVENDQQKIAGHIYKYYLSGFDAVRLRAEYLIEIISPSGKVIKKQLTINDDADMIFVQGNSSLVTNFAKSDTSCPTNLWGDFFLFNDDPNVRACVKPPIVGTLDGLANYMGRLFGFRRAAGTFFDMGSAGNFRGGGGSPKLGRVDVQQSMGSLGTYETILENGRTETSNELIFVPHEKKHLANAEDVDVLSMPQGRAQIFYIKGVGATSHIGLLNMDGPANDEQRSFPVCDLGAKGLGISWDALGVSTSSDFLVTNMADMNKFEEDNTSFRLATFFLKSSTGAFYRAFVIQNISGGEPLSFANHDDTTHLQCFVVGDKAQSNVIEYKRVFSGTPASSKRLWSLN